jgi:hypothetical protein
MRQAFIAYIHALFWNINSIVCNPSFTFLINLLESVQRNFTKRIPSISARTYPERLTLIGLELLEMRRLRANLVYCFKILIYIIPFNPNKVLLISTPIGSTQSNSPYLRKPAEASNEGLSALYFRCVEAWNALPASP